MCAPREPQAVLIRDLADGAFHSGTDLARALGLPRSTLRATLARLAGYGLVLETRRGTGYRLSRPLDLLHPEDVRRHYLVGSTRRDADIECAGAVGSTSSLLLAHAEAAGERVQCLLAEHQSAGRGRRGRRWVTPYAGGIALSVMRRFALGPGALGTLSLVAGVAAVEVLEALGIPGLGLKWPNDLVHREHTAAPLRKLGGLLVEVRGEPRGPCVAVIGIGVNVDFGSVRDGSIDQPWCDLRGLGADLVPGTRSRIAGELLAALEAACEAFVRDGARDYLARWPAHDVLAGREVLIDRAGGQVPARALGIDADGALRVDVAGREQRVHAGEVSIRPRS